MMQNINRTAVLNSLIRHETLTILNVRKAEKPGVVPDNVHLNFLLNELIKTGDIDTLNGVIPATFTIASKGIAEGKRLNETIEN